MKLFAELKSRCKTSEQRKAFNNLVKSFASQFASFLDAKGIRQHADFQVGQNIIVMKYDTHHYWTSYWGIYKIKKITKNSIIAVYIDNEDSEIKFDLNGICFWRTNNKYLGNFENSWVAYNDKLAKELPDLQELIKTGTVSWGFRVAPNDKGTIAKKLKNALKQL